ncbi:4Fe-4S dicluster domain-containing protein [Candidatus Bathyarchaeota archaeon]|nr:4Fe-4S dicluster domain-containing protein [Candidatus Bathyarchaeota archaeon]
MSKKRTGVYRADASSCNGCDIEIVAALASRFRLDELGVKVVTQPEEAGILLVTGGGNMKIDNDLKEVYERIQPPRIVAAIGSCAISWEAFAEGYSIVGPADETIPVDVYVCGCPPRPQAIVAALAKMLGKEIEEKEDFWHPPPDFRGKPDLDPEKCTACGACEQACPTKAIEVSEKDGKRTVKYLFGKCSYCRTCEIVCPDDAVKLTQKYLLVYKDRKAATFSADIALLRCLGCASFSISPRQIKRALNTIEENVKDYAEFLEDIEKAMGLCLNCRRKIQNIKEAKRLLVQLRAKALEKLQ